MMKITLIKNTKILFSFFIFILTISFGHQGLFADEYYPEVNKCPEGTITAVKDLGEVPAQLLPNRPPDQGPCPTCSIHAVTAALNAIYKKDQLEKNPDFKKLEKAIPDLSVVDAYFINKFKIKENTATKFNESTAIFYSLMDLLLHGSLIMEQGKNLTMAQAEWISSCMSDQMSWCHKNVCHQALGLGDGQGGSHSSCFSQLCQQAAFTEFPLIQNHLAVLGEFIGKHIQDKNKFDVMNRNPLSAFVSKERKKQNQSGQLPPVTIETFDQFESADHLIHELTNAWSKEKIKLPIVMTNFTHRSADRAHAVNVKKMTKTLCLTPDEGEVVMTFHSVWFLNSWGGKGEGPYSLEAIAEDMVKFRGQFIKVTTQKKQKENQKENQKEKEKINFIPNATSSLLHNLIYGRYSTFLRDLFLYQEEQLASSINSIDPHSGESVFEVALNQGDQESLHFVLSHPAFNPHQVMKSGITPLRHAAERRHTELFTRLIDHPRFNPQENEGEGTQLFFDLMIHNHELFSLMLQSRKWSPNEVDVKGNSILRQAVLYGNRDIVRKLLLAGANPALKDAAGFSVYDYTADFVILDQEIKQMVREVWEQQKYQLFTPEEEQVFQGEFYQTFDPYGSLLPDQDLMEPASKRRKID